LLFSLALEHTGCFKKSFTTLKEYTNLCRGHTQSCKALFEILPIIRKIQERFEGLELNGVHKLLVSACNLVEDNTHTINENTEILLNSSKEVGLEVNAEKTKYMFKIIT
jgi:hypothetical protein